VIASKPQALARWLFFVHGTDGNGSTELMEQLGQSGLISRHWFSFGLGNGGAFIVIV